MSQQIPNNDEPILSPGQSRRGFPEEARLRRVALFADGRLPTPKEKLAAFHEIKAMENTESYTIKHHQNWCSGQKVRMERQTRDLKALAEYIRMQFAQWPDAVHILQMVGIIRQRSEALGVSDELVYRVIRDFV